MQFPDIGDVLVFQGFTIVVTSMDFQTNDGTFKLFKSEKDAKDWCHEVSRKQMPEWHKEHCSICKEST